MNKSNWFDVNNKGLSELVGGRNKAFIVNEMIQNSWDQNVTKVKITLEPIKGRRWYKLVVTDDDPEGFKDITDSFTLFASSNKKDDPTKRGRFNLGEKLVLVLCDNAEIITTSGSVIFQKNGPRKSGRKKTEKGSTFSAVVKITKNEYEEICKAVSMLIPPQNIDTYFNGEKLATREPIRSFEAKLQTEKSRPDGVLTRTTRNTEVEIFSVLDGEEAHLYEMGIPVVATGDAFHVNIKQKIPLNMNRDNVTPAYLKKIRTLVYNNTYDLVDYGTVNETWVKEALSDSECDSKAVDASMDLRFSENRVIFDPSDHEANNKAVSNGFVVIHGSQLSKNEWVNVKKTGTTKPAGQVFPTPHPKSSPDGEPPIPYDKLTDKQKLVVDFTKGLARRIMGIDIEVNVYAINDPFAACYGGGEFSYNVKRLRASFFNNFPTNLEAVIDLIIHEFGHEYSGNHLSDEYYNALSKLGAKMTLLALADPKFFNVKESSL
ncbi:MAG: hypothetical protein FVQ82_02885 [Planctomycetes bacterium]|nr:hypothetical protein [Planctomycetota bacterium]